MWNLRVGLGVPVVFGEAKTNDVDPGAHFAQSYRGVIRLNISVDQGFCVNILDLGNELICKEQDHLQREFMVTEIEDILQARSRTITL